MQKDGVDSMDNSMGQKDVKEVQRHEVASANNSFRLENKKEIKKLLVTATMLEKKDDAGNDKGGVDDSTAGNDLTSIADSSSNPAATEI